MALACATTGDGLYEGLGGWSVSCKQEFTSPAAPSMLGAPRRFAIVVPTEVSLACKARCNDQAVEHTRIHLANCRIVYFDGGWCNAYMLEAVAFCDRGRS